MESGPFDHACNAALRPRVFVMLALEGLNLSRNETS